MTDCDESTTGLENISRQNKNTAATNITSTDLTKNHNKKVRYCYILQTVLLVIILILKISIIYYHYAKKCIMQNGKKWI